jgi:ABC-type transport system substrate-binding protein
MLLFMRNNRGAPGTAGMVPPSLYTDPLGQDFGYTYDPAMASELLEEAGFPGGVGLPAITLHTTAEYTGLATYLKDKLEDIGLALSIEVVDPRVLRELRVNKETAFFRGSWIADYSDPESYLQIFYGQNGAPPNYSRYSNPIYDSLYVMAVAETDPVERNLIYRSLDSIMMADAPVVPLYYDEVYRFTRKGIRGLEPDAMNMLKLKYVRMEESASAQAQ